MEPTVLELWVVLAQRRRLRGGGSSYMLATFFREPFWRSGKKVLVTRWTPRTLTVKLSVRFSLNTLAAVLS